MKRIAAGLVAVAAFTAAFVAIAHAGPEFDKQGKLVIPQGTDRWPTVGTTIAMSYETESSIGFNAVRMDPDSYEVYRKTGAFPVGTMLELEIRRKAAENAPPATGGSYAGQLVTHSVHIKDEKAGPGTWTFYSYRPGATVGTEIPRTEACYSCHDKSAKQDTVFTQFYPILGEAHEQSKAGR